jgi:hypothetical protein
LSLVLLYQRAGDEKFERAARRWIRRQQIKHRLRHQEVELLRAAMGALGTRFDGLAREAVLAACRALRLPPPTLQT